MNSRSTNSTWLLGRWLARRGLLASGCLFLSGCPNPNLYQTARTVPKGELSGSAAAELFVVRAPADVDTAGEYKPEVRTTAGPSLPSLMLRVGVGEHTDLGFHVYNAAVLGMDFKHLIIRGDIDVALAPGAHVHSVPGNEVTYSGEFYQLPVLVDFNVSPAFSVVLSPGIAYVNSSREGSDNRNAMEGSSGYSGTMTRFGLGLNLRASSGFALHPEATWLHGVSRDEPWDQFLVGLGFTFGSLPTFRD